MRSRMRLGWFQQRGVEDDALRVGDLADRFNHAVILCLTAPRVNRAGRLGRWRPDSTAECLLNVFFCLTRALAPALEAPQIAGSKHAVCRLRFKVDSLVTDQYRTVLFFS
jgi:hypothetical protein